MRIQDIKNPRIGDHCLLCGGRPAVIGVFIPDDPVSWGAATGKTRFVRYCLCHKCMKMPDAQERAEKVIKSELAGCQAVHYGE